MSSKQTGKQDPRPVDSKQSPDRVELRCEDLQHDERKRELAQGSADVGAFKGSLSSTDLHQLVISQHD